MNKVLGAKKQEMEGIVIVNKPTGMTSHDVVSKVRRIFNMRRVGHAGTLDPLATGVLVILLGKATKLFQKFEHFDKGYKATMILGTTTNTADVEGEILKSASYKSITQEQITDVFTHFVGDIQQVPPMFSAVRIKGQRLYQLARKGIVVERSPRDIRIDTLELLSFNLPNVSFYLECSKGTYVRKLAEDIGERLGCGACISQIQRTSVGPFVLEDAVSLEDLSVHHIKQWTDNFEV